MPSPKPPGIPIRISRIGFARELPWVSSDLSLHRACFPPSLRVRPRQIRRWKALWQIPRGGKTT
eukprot:4308571-Alexandrium_andersonii.AAC.1